MWFICARIGICFDPQPRNLDEELGGVALNPFWTPNSMKLDFTPMRRNIS